MKIHHLSLGLVVAAIICAPSSAEAHGGSGAAYTGVAGPFKVVAYDGRLSASESLVEYRLMLLRVDTQQPADGATVTTEAQLMVGDYHHEPVQKARSTGNVYYFNLPNLTGATWYVTATITKGLEAGSTSYYVHQSNAGAIANPLRNNFDAGTSSSGSKATQWIIGALSVGLFVFLAVVIAVRRRRTAS